MVQISLKYTHPKSMAASTGALPKKPQCKPFESLVSWETVNTSFHIYQILFSVSTDDLQLTRHWALPSFAKEKLSTLLSTLYHFFIPIYGVCTFQNISAIKSCEKMLPLASVNICFQANIPKEASLSRLNGPNYNVLHTAPVVSTL